MDPQQAAPGGSAARGGRIEVFGYSKTYLLRIMYVRHL